MHAKESSLSSAEPRENSYGRTRVSVFVPPPAVSVESAAPLSAPVKNLAALTPSGYQRAGALGYVDRWVLCDACNHPSPWRR